MIHPDWLAVGNTVTLRRLGVGGRVEHEARVRVTRHTLASVFIRYTRSGTEDRFVLRQGRYVDVQKYLDTTTVLVLPDHQEPT